MVVFNGDTFIVGLLSYKALVSHCAELVLFLCRRSAAQLSSKGPKATLPLA